MHIPGPVGPLESILDQATAEKTITAVLCHPHPQYGGSMHDGVLNIAAQALLAYGINCLRFNFRGVGSSAGSFAQGAGESEDLLSVTDWLHAEYPRDDLWLVGYSFGANVVYRTVLSQPVNPPPTRTILIAPPVGVMDFSGTLPVESKMRIDAVAGDRDDFVDAQTFTQWDGAKTHTICGQITSLAAIKMNYPPF